MTENRRRLYIALLLVGGGALYFVIKVLSGEPPADAAILSAIYIVGIGITLAIVLRIRRKTLRKLADQGQVEGYLRRPDGRKDDRYRKWNFGLITPIAGVLTFQPVFGTTSIARGEPFEIHPTPASGGARYPASKWDKFNRLEANAIVLPLETVDGPIEVAAQAGTLNKIVHALTGSEAPNPQN